MASKEKTTNSSISFKDYTKGTILVGYVKKIQKDKVDVQLPDFKHGFIPLSDEFPVSSALKLKNRRIACCVKDDSNGLKLSIDPAEINESLDPEHLSNGDTLWGITTTQEDFGYSVNLGLNVNAFIQTHQNLDETTYSFFTVKNATKRLIELSILQNGAIGKNLTIGNFLKCKVDKNDQLKSFVKFFDNYLGKLDNITASNHSLIGKTENFRVIVLNPNKQQLTLTTSPIFDDFSTICVGDFVKAKFHSANYLPYYVFLLKNGNYCYCHKNDLHNQQYNKDKFAKFRIKDVDLICGYVKISNIPSFMSLKCIKIEDLKVGQCLSGIVCKINDFGYEISISPYLFGFIYKNSVIGAKFELKQQVSCRVLFVDRERNKIILTSVPELLNEKEAIISSYEVDSDDVWYTGVVEKLQPSYAILKFFNNVSGLLHRSETNFTVDLDKCISIGMPLKVRVLSGDPDNRRLVLSARLCNTTANDHVISVSNAVFGYQITFKIAETDQHRVNATTTLVNDCHLSDFQEHFHIFKSVLQQNPNINLTAFDFGRESCDVTCSTLKYSIVRSAQLSKIPETIENISVDDCYAGFVSKITEVGVEVTIGVNLIGFVPVKNASFNLGDSVAVNVTEIDHSRNRLIFNFLSAQSSQKASPFLVDHGLILSYFKEREFLTQYYFSHLKYLKVGRLAKVKIVERISETLYSCRYKKQYGTLFACPSLEYNKDDVVVGCCLFWDFDPLHVYFVPSDDQKISGNTVVTVIKNFKRFSVGYSQSENKIIIIVSNHTCSDVNKLKEKASVECCYVSSLKNISLCGLKSHVDSQPSRVLSCQITKITPTGVKVKDSKQKIIYVHASTIAGVNEGDRPLERLCVGDFIDVYKLIYNPNPHSSYRRNRYSLSPNYMPISPEKLVSGVAVTAIVSKYENRQVFFEIDSNLRAHCNIVDLVGFNDLNFNPVTKYTPGTAVKMVVCNFEISSNSFRVTKQLSKPHKLGQYVVGRIFCHDLRRHLLLLDLHNNSIGYLHVTDLGNTLVENPLQTFPLGMCVKAKVSSIVKQNNYYLTMRSEPCVESLVENNVYECYVVKVLKHSVHIIIGQKIKGVIYTSKGATGLGFENNQQIKPYLVVLVKFLKYSRDKIAVFMPVISEKDVDMPCENVPAVSHHCFSQNQHFDWQTGEFADQYDLSKSIDVKENIAIIEQSKSLNEMEIREIEHKLANNSLLPNGVEDFERLVAASPDSSIVWIQYMCFYMLSFELEKARLVCERALKSISFRLLNELTNVHLASINIECLYGTTQSLKDARSRAYSVCSKKKVISHMVELYFSVEQLQNCEQECFLLLKMFPSSKKSYFLYGKLLASQKRFLEMKDVLKKGLQFLAERKHIQHVLQFGLFEFKYGDPQRGCTLIESILNNHPHRIDVWFTYIDQLIKANLIDNARTAFDKLIVLSLKKSKRRLIFNRYLAFENKYGDKQSISVVQSKIAELITNV